MTTLRGSLVMRWIGTAASGRRRNRQTRIKLFRRAARTEVLDQPQQYPRTGVDVGRLDMLVRMMADAATAAHEHHADIGKVDHGHAVMPGPARQFEHAIALAGNGLRYLAPEPWRAGHGTVFV